jgi:hypothetical protein
MSPSPAGGLASTESKTGTRNSRGSSPRPRRESPEDFRRTLIRLSLQMPHGLKLLGCQIEDSRAQNALGPELEEPSKLLDRVGNVVCPDGEIEDDHAQNQFSLPQFGHQGTTHGRLGPSSPAMLRQLEDAPSEQKPDDRPDEGGPPAVHSPKSLAEHRQRYVVARPSR